MGCASRYLYVSMRTSGAVQARQPFRRFRTSGSAQIRSQRREP